MSDVLVIPPAYEGETIGFSSSDRDVWGAHFEEESSNVPAPLPDPTPNKVNPRN